MKQLNLIKKDKVKLEAINDKIHKWLLKNREGYNAEKWSDVIENDSNAGEFAIPLPDDDNGLEMLEIGLINMKKGKLKDNWFKPQTI